MLIGNYSVLNKLPMRWRGGSTSSPETTARSNFGCSGPARNIKYVDQTTTAQVTKSVPFAMTPPYTWTMAQKDGNISARASAVLSFDANATGVLGMPGSGTATITFTVPDVAGQLIVSGSGSASFAITTNNPLLTASVNGAGSAAMSFAANATIGALAFGSGSANITFSVAGSLLPSNDASPLRTGVATMSFSATLTSYAVGNMSGSTIDNSVLTPAQIASAVWKAVSSENNDSGTMGNKLNSASAAGDPWTAEMPGSYADGSAGSVIYFLSQIIKNKKSIIQDETGKRLVIYDDNGITPLISKVLTDVNGDDIVDLASGVLAREEASSV